MRNHRANWLMLFAAMLACDQYDSPTIPGAGTSPPFVGTATVLSATGSCPGSRAGDTFSGVVWEVRRSGATAIELVKVYDVLERYIYDGTTDGSRFEARFQSGLAGCEDCCFVRESRLEGKLAPDGNSFEAKETLEWSGVGDGVEVVVWRVSR